jgi:ankyrin repeat protein
MDMITARDLTNLQNLYDHTPYGFFSSIVDRFGSTPLMIAAEMGSMDTIRFFLGKIDIHVRNNRGNSAVTIAAKVLRHDVVELLVKRGGADLEDLVYEVNGFGDLVSDPLTVFFHTVAFGQRDTFKWMCQEDGGLTRLESLDSSGNTAFHHVVRKGYLDEAQWIANFVGKVGRCANSNDMSPLMYALHNKDLPMTRWLLREGHADKNDIVIVGTGETAVFAAARHNRVAIFVDLVEEMNPDLSETNNAGQTIWDVFTWARLNTAESAQVLSTLLSRVAPPDYMLPYMIDDHRILLSESKKLRELIVPFLQERETSLANMKIPCFPKKGQTQIPLPFDIVEKILTFDSTFTTDELWATKLGDPKAKRDLRRSLPPSKLKRPVRKSL